MIYMMKPNYDKHNNKKKTRRGSKKGTMRLLLSFLLVGALMLTAWIQEKSSAGRNDEPVLQDLALLTDWGDKLLQDEGRQWSFRWDVLLPRDTMEQLAEQFFRTKKGKLLAKNIRSNGQVIDGKLELPSSYMRLVRTEQDKLAEKLTITLQLDSAELDSISELTQLVANIQQTLHEKDHNVQMSMKVYGKANDSNAMQTLKQYAVAQMVEEYKDRGTISTTMFSSRIKQYRWLNNEKMANLQAVLHESSTTGDYELTIGIPLISGEFGGVISDQSQFEMNN